VPNHAWLYPARRRRFRCDARLRMSAVAGMNEQQWRRLQEKWPWWTEADQAELNILIHAFVDAEGQHRERCETCSVGGPWCTSLREAFEAVLEWRTGRHLRSKAAWLRAREQARQDLAEWKTAAA
jgi:hypothetical protein